MWNKLAALVLAVPFLVTAGTPAAAEDVRGEEKPIGPAVTVTPEQRKEHERQFPPAPPKRFVAPKHIGPTLRPAPEAQESPSRQAPPKRN